MVLALQEPGVRSGMLLWATKLQQYHHKETREALLSLGAALCFCAILGWDEHQENHA